MTIQYRPTNIYWREILIPAIDRLKDLWYLGRVSDDWHCVKYSGTLLGNDFNIVPNQEITHQKHNVVYSLYFDETSNYTTVNVTYLYE